MPIEVDIRKTFLYKWGKEEGLKEGEQMGLVKGLKEGEKRGLEKGKKEGLKEGLIRGLKKAILLGIQLKFSSQKAKQIKIILDRINDINHLEKIKKEVIRAKTWDDFVRSIKNSNSNTKIQN